MGKRDEHHGRTAALAMDIRDSLPHIAGTPFTYAGLTPGSERIPALAGDLLKRLAVFAYRLQARDLWIVFLGGTGTGKSTLFNAFTGKELSRTGVERPKTSGPIAYAARDSALAESFPFPGMRPERRPAERPGAVPTAGMPDRLLWMEHGDDVFPGWIVVDTPDLDSVEVGNRRVSEDLYLLSDVVVFVASQEKYADEAPCDFLGRVVRDKRPCFLLLNKATEAIAAEEVLEVLKKNGVSLPPEAVTVIPYAPSRPFPSISRSPAFRGFLKTLREGWGPERADALRKARSAQSASELISRIEALVQLLEAERLAGRVWRDRVQGLFEAAWRELIREERRRFTEKSREYLGKEIRRLFGRYDVLARPRKIMGDILLTPFRMAGLFRKDDSPNPDEALSKVRKKTDPTPVLSAVERLNRSVLESLSPSQRGAPLFAEIRQNGVALDREEILGSIRDRQVELVAWLEARFRELADGIPAGKKWGIYSMSILWGLLILSLQGAVGGGFTLLDAFLGASLAPFVTRGAVELFAYQEIQQVARDISKRYQDGLVAILGLQRDRYVRCIDELLPPDDLLQRLEDLLRRLRVWAP